MSCAHDLECTQAPISVNAMPKIGRRLMFNFVSGMGCVFGGIYVMETSGGNSTVMSAVGGFLILIGMFRLVMMLLDMGQ